jgi:hypothetical protein
LYWKRLRAHPIKFRRRSERRGSLYLTPGRKQAMSGTIAACLQAAQLAFRLPATALAHSGLSRGPRAPLLSRGWAWAGGTGWAQREGEAPSRAVYSGSLRARERPWTAMEHRLHPSTCRPDGAVAREDGRPRLRESAWVWRRGSSPRPAGSVVEERRSIAASSREGACLRGVG